VNGEWAMVKRAMGNGQWAMGNGQWAKQFSKVCKIEIFYGPFSIIIRRGLFRRALRVKPQAFPWLPLFYMNEHFTS
jgi:hypothetical protein